MMGEASEARKCSPCGDDGIGLLPVEQYNYIGAYDPSESDAEGFFESAVIIFLDVLDEIEEHFGVGVALEAVTFFGELAFELGIIFNDAVVDHGEAAAGGAMGVSIPIAGFAVGGPTGMAHAGVGVDILSYEAVFQLGYFAFLFMNTQVLIEQGDA